MPGRDTEYVLVRSRKPKKTRQYYYDDDEADDDDDSQIYTRVVRRKPRREQRMRYISSDDIESDYRRQSSDVCACVFSLLNLIDLCFLSSQESKFAKQRMAIK